MIDRSTGNSRWLVQEEQGREERNKGERMKEEKRVLKKKTTTQNSYIKKNQ